MICTIFDYGGVLWDSCLKSEPDFLEKKNRRKAALICTGAFRITSHERLLKELGWSKLETRRTLHRLALFYNISLPYSYLPARSLYNYSTQHG